MKHVLVVGGSGGLGRPLVEIMLDHKYHVSVAGRNRPQDERISHFFPIDAVDTDWHDLYQTIEKETNLPLDGVIFVAGGAVFGRTSQIPSTEARHVFDLNFWASTTAATTAAEYWSQKNQQGIFLAVLSIAGKRAVPFEAYYSASKAATMRFLECLQLEYDPHQIKIMAAFPGFLKTSFGYKSKWYGLEPNFSFEGADPHRTARIILDIFTSKRKTRLIGWRERIIDLADRFLPGLYDRLVLRKRVQKTIQS